MSIEEEELEKLIDADKSTIILPSFIGQKRSNIITIPQEDITALRSKGRSLTYWASRYRAVKNVVKLIRAIKYRPPKKAKAIIKVVPIKGKEEIIFFPPQ
jgi:hypothetical protein